MLDINYLQLFVAVAALAVRHTNASSAAGWKQGDDYSALDEGVKRGIPGGVRYDAAVSSAPTMTLSYQRLIPLAAGDAPVARAGDPIPLTANYWHIGGA